MKRGCFRVGQRSEVVEDGAKSSGGDLEGAAAGKIDEVGFVVFVILELVERVAFEEAGDAFDPETARKLEAFILSKGGSREAEDLYTSFRGRMPGVEALLKGRGLAA